jgi:HD-like signal output (HDOD) protein
LENLGIEMLIDMLDDLPPMPDVAKKARELIRDNASSISDLASLISLDQAMSALVLRWANSAYFGLAQPVSNLHQAMIFLGYRHIENLVLAASLSTFMERPIPGYGLKRGELWKHAIAVAGGAHLAAAPFGHEVAEDAYYAGLLCDVGKLAFEQLLRDVDLTAPEWQDESFPLLEEEHFGFDHAQLGGALAERWNLPEHLIDAIRFHHDPQSAQDGSVLAAAVHIADCAASALGIGVGREGLQYAIQSGAFVQLGIDECEYHVLMDKIGSLIREAEFHIQGLPAASAEQSPSIIEKSA